MSTCHVPSSIPGYICLTKCPNLKIMESQVKVHITLYYEIVHSAEKSINLNMNGGWSVYLSEIKGKNAKGNLDMARSYGYMSR